ncbi:MAG: DUF3040 domain-containing protein [Actinophytocola sp.]|uniref:DUF3040 domain-containing protein n=1 Tax=Actinophytocola sp. TaxID=1872138 RepID=UPI0013210389|nr:DUF3040 domain-containing protein [Actinophytocola sp.]MPZ86366.1 DUF3040 domain-containing protein [Actinophytocola sp.]
MLSDRERAMLREIERRLAMEDPRFVRSFYPVERRPPGDHHRRAHPSVLVVKVTLLTLLLVGPNPLTESQVANRARPPAPRRSSAPPGGVAAAYAPPAPEHPGPADISGILAHPVPSPSTTDRITPTAAA